jgi:hypothetical protein
LDLERGISTTTCELEDAVRRGWGMGGGGEFAMRWRPGASSHMMLDSVQKILVRRTQIGALLRCHSGSGRGGCFLFLIVAVIVVIVASLSELEEVLAAMVELLLDETGCSPVVLKFSQAGYPFLDLRVYVSRYASMAQEHTIG